jgi:hypothetical protein
MPDFSGCAMAVEDSSRAAQAKLKRMGVIRIGKILLFMPFRCIRSTAFVNG